MTKLEEIARAIGMLNGAANSQDGLLWAWSSQDRRNECLEFARAAVDAMREPTEDMRAAPRQLHDKILFVSEIWQAMIDAILNEKESP